MKKVQSGRTRSMSSDASSDGDDMNEFMDEDDEDEESMLNDEVRSATGGLGRC